ncbi:hypothetical protein [Paenibacillus sp. YN15]|uniref:hypothetical protein n=1 Tax=Paenibacillus sp. YN15 TaxID=1742774 RepID=UPI000DCC7AAD|nr:hypothetical protein [Paenibacillus sp. YN15]RAU99805.1 hypothetical protein DQG13_14975 [Paenibacillus sp. YN15]
MIISSLFPRYKEHNPLVPVWCVTPAGGGLHRFFDTSPVSPSGRYLAVLRMPQLERANLPGEAAEVVLVDLHTAEEQVLAATIGWEYQLGANINWGADDESLFFNDVDPKSWQPQVVRINPLTGERRLYEGSIYRISPDGRTIICADAAAMRRTQFGYGVVVPDERVPRRRGFASDDGLYATDVATGERKLLVSLRHVMEQVVPPAERRQYEDGELYGFHCKFNPQGDRLIFTMRWFPSTPGEPWNKINEGLRFWVVTMRPDGTDIHLAVGPEQWIKGGHHINWCPDGEHLSMNLKLYGDNRLLLVQVRYDGTGLRTITEAVPGSGHPTVHPDGRHILTDTYEKEPVAYGDGTVPLRWIDLQAGSEVAAVRINVAHQGSRNQSFLRVDPHPAWAPDNRHVVFNGYVDGDRRVFIADMGPLLGLK